MRPSRVMHCDVMCGCGGGGGGLGGGLLYDVLMFESSG